MPQYFQKYRKNIPRILALACLAGLAVFIFASEIQFLSLDLGRHLKNGEIVFSNPDVLFKNTYSFTKPDEPFINHHWLSGAIYFLFYRLGAFPALSVLNIAAALLAIGITFRIASEKAGFWTAGIVTILPILMMSERSDIRPEMFSYLLIAVFIWLIERYDASGNAKCLTALAVLQALWVNLHIYFFMGPLIVGLYLSTRLLGLDKINPRSVFPSELKQSASRLRQNFKSAKPLFFGFGLVCLATLANPNFIKGAVYPLLILKDYGYTIAENMSPWFMENVQVNHNIVFFKALLAILLVSYVASAAKRFRPISYLDLLLLFSAAIAWKSIRNFPIFAISSILAISMNFAFVPRMKKVRGHLLAFIFFALAAGALAFCVSDYSGGRSFIKHERSLDVASGARSYVEFFEQNLQGPIFNNYDLGSSLIFQLYPREKVFVDNRPEAYGLEFFSSIYKPMLEDADAWDKYSLEFGINAVIVSHTDATPWARSFIARMFNNPEWPLVYLDGNIMILAKANAANARVIDRHAYGPDKIRERIKFLYPQAGIYGKFYLAQLASQSGAGDLALEIIQAILGVNKNDGRAWALLGSYVLSDGKRESVVKSIDYLNRAVDSGYKLPAAYIQLGLNYFSLGDPSKAEKYWQEALRRDKKNNTAQSYLDQLRELGY